MLNARTLKEWIVSSLGPQAVSKHMIAVSTNLKVLLNLLAMLALLQANFLVIRTNGQAEGESKVSGDVIGLITEFTEAENYYMQSHNKTTLSRIITLRDASNYEVKIYLWGQKAVEFDGGFSLSGNAAARWYINAEFPEVAHFADRVRHNYPPIVIVPVQDPALPALEPLPEPEIRSLQQIKETSPYDFPPEG